MIRSGKTLALQYQAREQCAILQYLTARLHILLGDLSAARTALAESMDLLERLGMRRELAEARAELARLDAGVAPATEQAESSANDAELSRQTPAMLVDETKHI